MNLTYNEILDTMKTAFYKEKGEHVKNLSDLEARFKAVASEIYSVSAYGDFIMKQSFPQTATGTYLEQHAALRKITRKTASYAKGSITVSRTESSAGTVITIPKNTIFSVSGKPFIQFSSNSEIKIAATASSATVAVTALKTGSEYNIDAGIQLAAVNPPAHLASAVSKAKFSGGWDGESDSALRKRILNSYSSRKNAVSIEAVRETILTLDEVTDVSLRAETGYKLNVCLKTKSGAITGTLKNQIIDMLGFARLCSITLEFTAATEQTFAVTAEAKILSGYSASEISKAVRERITEFCSDEKIGQNYSESAIAAYCGGISGVEYINIFLGTKSISVAPCASNSFLKLDSIEVYTYE